MFRVLVSAGLGVPEAATGGSALRLAQLQPDAIVLDLVLPDIDGLEVVRRLKASAATVNIPVDHKTASTLMTSISAMTALRAPKST
jgi:CheY-like chemotaxis protein